jgi:phosphoglycerol transferase MdoB-like AlkP superfamily enzyme
MKNRFVILLLMLAVFLGLAFMGRLVLLFTSFAQVDIGIIALAKVFLIGFFYDFVAASYYVLPLAVYLTVMPDRGFNNKIHKYTFLIFLFIQVNLLVFALFSEWFFWEEFGKRFDFIAVDYLMYTTEVVKNILESYPIPILISVVVLISSVIFYILYRKTTILDTAFSFSHNFLHRLKIGVSFIVLPALFFCVLHEQSFASVSSNQFNNELSKNGFYSLFSAFRNNAIDYDVYYKKERLETVLPHLKAVCSLDSNATRFVRKTGQEQRYNVVLIMVESLSAEYVGAFGDTRGLTPYLDRLARKSLFFDNVYATGTRTDRGMEAVVLSVPPTPGRSIIKRPDCHAMFSAGFLFKEKGYETKFLYAGFGYFDNMNEFFSNNGFVAVDRNDLAADEITFANAWGACDEDLFGRVLKEADASYKNNKPFFTFAMTTSNHRPYTYPDGKIDIPSRTGRGGGVKYTDYAIHTFLSEAARKPWFKNTLFVIVADHNGGSAGGTSLPASRYKIPLLIYAPNIIRPRTVSKLSSQIDLIPTLVSLMNWSYKSKFYGEDILAKNFEERAFIGTYQKLGFIKNNKLVMLEPGKSIHEYTIVRQTLYDVQYKEIDPVKEDTLDAITYYQSASYFYKAGINRWVDVKK